MHTQGAAFRSTEGPPDKRNAARSANRDGVKHVSKLDASTNKYEATATSSTGNRTGQRKDAAKDVHPILRFRPRQLQRLSKRRHGRTLPDNDVGRRFMAIMLDHLVRGPDGQREALDFLILSCPWTAPGDRPGAVDSAIQRNKFWTHAALGDALGLTWDEHDACRITTIRPAGASDADMAAVRKMKNTAAKTESRQQEKLHKLPALPLPVARAMAISDVLKPGERCTVKELCDRLKRRLHFSHMKGAGLVDAAHRAIAYGIEHGFLRKDVEPGPRGMQIAWISTGDKGGTSRGQTVCPPSPVRLRTEKSIDRKSGPQLRVLLIEEGLPTLSRPAAPSYDTTAATTFSPPVPDGRGRAERCPASTGPDTGPTPNETVVGKKEDDLLWDLEATGTEFQFDDWYTGEFDQQRPQRDVHCDGGVNPPGAALSVDAVPATNAEPCLALAPTTGPCMGEHCGRIAPGTCLGSLPENDFPPSAAGASPVRALGQNLKGNHHGPHH